ncbi:MAG: adenylosuccinate lyase [Clostridiales bacterium]|nr:adenylosuccinate lyase [Clostridiales bacterium]
MAKDRYESPFSQRYASDEMQYLFSSDKKFSTWRRLWLSLAKAEKALGLDITDEQIAEMSAHLDDIDYDLAAKYESELRHDVMAHIKTFGDACPSARPIIHLGATSCYVGDNTDMIIMKEALSLIRKKLLAVLFNLRAFAEKYKDMPSLAYTHLQPAQLTTVGKRATLWAYELLLDLRDLDYVSESLCLLGQKGTTGTQASFVELFDGDMEKIAKLEKMIASDFGFDSVVPVSGQTYTRKFDTRVINVLAGIAQSSYKFANDFRILQSFKEMEEPFEKNQVGSSAMPYKRNPMRCERICALSRYLISDAANPAMTSSTQWFERTLDDSANRRISIAEAFLACDAILGIYVNVTSDIAVYPNVIRRRVMAELPFMASENIMMDLCRHGADRQEVHAKIRAHALEAGRRVKEEGLENDLIDRLASDPSLNVSKEEILAVLVPENYVGAAPMQTETFIKEQLDPVLDENSHISIELNV